MSDEAATTAAPPAPSPEAEKRTRPPLNDAQRAAAADRARKRRQLAKLKSAKTEGQLKELAAEVALSPDVDAASTASRWPSGEEFQKAAVELAPVITEGAAFLEGTEFALDEKRVKILTLSLAPAAAQAAKDPGSSAIARMVSPGLVAVLGLLLVFGPPAVRVGRDLYKEFKAPERPAE